MHAATFDVVENLPAAHWVHFVAPVVLPVFVIGPALQFVHVPTFDWVEYLPVAQAEHVVAPALAPVLVMDPAAHSEQYDLPDADWN